MTLGRRTQVKLYSYSRGNPGSASQARPGVSVGRVPRSDPTARGATFPLGASVTIAELAADPHPVLRRLRESEPVSWLPALGGWLVTRADLAESVLRDARTFTVDDPRFTTARVVGPSMLSLDGDEHRRHRDPFARALRTPQTRSRLARAVEAEAARLVTALAANGDDAAAPELRRGLAGPLAVAVMAEMLGLDVAPGQLLAWYDAIVAGVSALAEAHQFRPSQLRNRQLPLQSCTPPLPPSASSAPACRLRSTAASRTPCSRRPPDSSLPTRSCPTPP